MIFKRLLLQYDSFKIPEYSAPYTSNGYEEGNEILGIPKSSLPKLIFIAIILLVVAYFALDYFVFSVKTVSISINNLEGKPVNALARVFDSASNEILSLSNESEYSFPLRRGNYSVRITAGSYKTESKDITEQDFSKNISLEFEIEKRLGILIEGIELQQEAFAGQLLQGKILLKNASGQDQEIELILEGDIEDNADVNIVKDKITAGKDGLTTIGFSVALNKSIRRITDDGKELKGKIRVKYSKEEKDFSLKVFKAPELSFQPTSVKFSGVNLADLTDYAEMLKISNKDAVATPEITALIELTKATENSLTEAIEWISFAESNSRELKFSLSSKGSKDIELKLSVPLTAKKETIDGKITFTADFLEKPKEVSLSIRILQEAVLDLTALIKPSNQAEISFDSRTNKFESLNNFFIEIENNGTIEVNNIDLLLLNQSECNQNYLQIQGDVFIQSLKASENKKIPLLVSMPASDVNSGKQQNCSLLVQYRDPLDESLRQTIDLNLLITEET